MEWVNTILQGVLLGGLYAMFAAGLSLIFGVMRLVNIAHGDLIVLAAYVALVVVETLGINPLTSLLIVVPVMAALGYVLQRVLLNRTLGDDLLPPLLVTFGLSVIIQNALHGAVHRRSAAACKRRTRNRELPLLPKDRFGDLPLLQFVLAVAVIAPASRVLPHARSAALSRDRGRSGGRAADGPRQPPRLRARDGGVARGGRDRRRAARDRAPISIPPSAGAADLWFEAVIIGGLGSLWGYARGGHRHRRRAAIGGHNSIPGWRCADRATSCSSLSSCGTDPRAVPEGAADDRARHVRRRPRRVTRAIVPVRCALAAGATGGRARRPSRSWPKSTPMIALASLWNLLAGYAGLVSVGSRLMSDSAHTVRSRSRCWPAMPTADGDPHRRADRRGLSRSRSQRSCFGCAGIISPSARGSSPK
jgi:branched-chain amino acid transport system permease protein